MDLPLWNHSDDQGYLTSDQSSYCNEDHLLNDFCFGYGRDLIEEDALNEKSCLQVLKILMDKADEDIVKLEEDIVMLQCQLAWDDEDWSVAFSAALREKIEHLDRLIECLEKKSTEGVHYLDLQLKLPVELPPSLHDIVKPLLENHLGKNKQVPEMPAVGLGNNKSEASTSEHGKKIEENGRTIVLKTDNRRSQSMELEEWKLNDPQQPSNPMEKDLTANTSIKKERESEESVHLKSPEPEMQISDIIKVDYMKQRTETSSKVRKPRVYSCAINKTVHSTKPSVKMKRNGTNFPETTEALEAQKTGRKYITGAFNNTTEHAREQNVKLENHVQVQQRHEITTPVINQVRSISYTDPEGQGPKINCRADPEIVQNSYVAKNIDVRSSTTENLQEQHKYGVLEKIRKKDEEKTQLQLKGINIDTIPEVTITSITSPQKIMKSSLNPETITKKRGLKDFLMKLVKTEHDTSSIKTEEVTYGAGDVAQNSSLCFKDVGKLTVNDLRAIAKNRGMQGYTKFRKAELQKVLGLEPYINLRIKNT